MNEIKQKFDKFWKLAFILSVVSIIVQGLLKLIFKVDWFDLEVNRNIENFFLFRNEIAIAIISQLMALYNFIIFIAIASKSKIKAILSNPIVLILLLSTWLLNLLPQETIFYMSPITGLIILVVFNILNNKDIKQVLKASFIFILVSIIMFIYQVVTIAIRLNHIPNPATVYSFYEKAVYVFDMYIMCYFYYKAKGVK